MSIDWCPKCGDPVFYYPHSGHKCLPRWEVWEEDEDRDDASITYAVDSEQAAEKWAEQEDAQGDYCIIGGSEVTAYVAKEGDGDVRIYTVNGRTEAVYTAKEVILVTDDSGL